MVEKVQVINCPKCGGQLEVLLGGETCVCKYCKSTVKIPVSEVDFKLVKNEKVEVTVDGKTTVYNSVNDMPPELREMFKRLRGGVKKITDIVEKNGEYTINGVHYGPIDKVPEEYRQKIINIRAGLPPSGDPNQPGMQIKHSRNMVGPSEAKKSIKLTLGSGFYSSDVPESLFRYLIGRYEENIWNKDPKCVVFNYCPNCQGEVEYKKTFFGIKRCVKCKTQVIIVDIKNGTVWVHW